MVVRQSKIHFYIPDSNGPIIFQIDASRAPVLYKVGQSVISCRLKLLKIDANGTESAPDDQAKVCLKNNSLNTLFSKSLLTVNDISVSNSIEMHYLKANLHILLNR